MELQQGDVVNQHVIAPLQEGGIDGKYGDHPLLGQSGRHAHRMALGNSHVEKAGPEGGREQIQAGPLLHGRRNGADARILHGKLAQGLAEGL